MTFETFSVIMHFSSTPLIKCSYQVQKNMTTISSGYNKKSSKHEQKSEVIVLAMSSDSRMMYRWGIPVIRLKIVHSRKSSMMCIRSGKVLSFYRDLASNVQNNEYLDESKFTVAPEGFSDDMREFYSPTNIQQCHDEDAKKQKIQETQKE